MEYQAENKTKCKLHLALLLYAHSRRLGTSRPKQISNVSGTGRLKEKQTERKSACCLTVSANRHDNVNFPQYMHKAHPQNHGLG